MRAGHLSRPGYARSVTPAQSFPEPTDTSAIRIIGRFEAGRGIPDAMRSDVRMLGALLGQVLREAGGDDLFADVERLRLATIQAYDEETSDAFERAAAIAESFTIERADEVARAFTCYFHLVNLAEEHQRVRVLRERAGQPGREDAADTVARVIEDRDAGRLEGSRPPADETAAWLLDAADVVVEWEGWEAIDLHEKALGEPHGRPRVKLVRLQELTEAAAAARAES